MIVSPSGNKVIVSYFRAVEMRFHQSLPGDIQDGTRWQLGQGEILPYLGRGEIGIGKIVPRRDAVGSQYHGVGPAGRNEIGLVPIVKKLVGGNPGSVRLKTIGLAIAVYKVKGTDQAGGVRAGPGVSDGNGKDIGAS